VRLPERRLAPITRRTSTHACGRRTADRCSHDKLRVGRFEDKEKKAQEIKDAFIEFKRWKEVGMAIRARPMGTLREWLEHVAHVHPLDVDAAVAESANTSNC